MMGEYVLYYRGKVFGGIYDDRFLVKPTKSAKAMMPDADMELPYEGAKEMTSFIVAKYCMDSGLHLRSNKKYDMNFRLETIKSTYTADFFLL